MAETFETFIEKERTRLNKLREDIFNQQQELETKLAQVNNELNAITAYEAAKAGKPITFGTKRAAPAGTRTRRSGRRDAILAVLKDAPGGLTRADLLEKLGAKGDTKQEQSVSNALTNMKKAGQLDQKDGKYVATGAQ